MSLCKLRVVTRIHRVFTKRRNTKPQRFNLSTNRSVYRATASSRQFPSRARAFELQTDSPSIAMSQTSAKYGAVPLDENTPLVRRAIQRQHQGWGIRAVLVGALALGCVAVSTVVYPSEGYGATLQGAARNASVLGWSENPLLTVAEVLYPDECKRPFLKSYGCPCDPAGNIWGHPVCALHGECQERLVRVKGPNVALLHVCMPRGTRSTPEQPLRRPGDMCLSGRDEECSNGACGLTGGYLTCCPHGRYHCTTDACEDVRARLIEQGLYAKETIAGILTPDSYIGEAFDYMRALVRPLLKFKFSAQASLLECRMEPAPNKLDWEKCPSERNSECKSGDCGRFGPNNEFTCCGNGMTTILGKDYCKKPTWEECPTTYDSECESDMCGYYSRDKKYRCCDKNYGMHTKWLSWKNPAADVCNEKRGAGESCDADDDLCASGQCFRTTRNGSYKCCGRGTFFCYPWTSGNCKSGRTYCKGYLGH